MPSKYYKPKEYQDIKRWTRTEDDKGKTHLGRGEVNINEIVTEQKDPKIAKMLRSMIKKQKAISWQPSITVKGVLAKQLFSAIVTDKRVIKERGILFSDNITVDKIINREVAQDWNFEWWAYEDIELRGAAGQLVMSSIKFKFPTIDKSKKGVMNITKYFKNATIINYWVARSVIDDELYTIIKEFLKTFDIFYNPYTLAIGVCPRTSKSWIGASVSLEALLQAEIDQGYVNEQIGDKDRRMSYTHMLRRNLNLNLQTWQKELIQNWKQYNFIAWSRRIWKTYTSAYIAYREFYRVGSWYWDRNRQVLYVTISDNKAWQPFQYMLQMTEEDRQLGYITVNKSSKEFTCTITNTKLIFITASAKGWAASYGADLVIVDEAAMVANEFWDDLLPIIIQEKSTVFAISTINDSSKQNWFYRYLLKWEMWEENIQAIRVTIDDNELLWDTEREAMKEWLINNQMKYWTQLYSIFPSWSTIFQLSWVIKALETEWKRPLVIIGYDVAKISDNASFVVLDPSNFDVIEEHFMKWISYMEQKEYLINLKKRHHKSVVVMDRSWVWEWVFEIFWDLIDCSVKYKATWDVKYMPLWYWTASKWELIETLRLYVDEYWLSISDTLENLIKEMKHFKVLRDRWTVIQYWGVWFTDDSVNALALITFYLRHISWVTSPLDLWGESSIINLDQYGNVIDNSWVSIFTESYDYQKTYNDFIY